MSLPEVNTAPSIVIDGITVNIVQVVVNAISQTGGVPESGHLHFEVNDIVWVEAANVIAAIDPIDIYANGGFTGEALVNLVAMDNEGFSTNWAWVLSGMSMGIQMQPRLLTVNYANGAQQTLGALLASSTVVTS